MNNRIVFLALGSNVGNRQENIAHAAGLLSKKIANIRLSSIYETKPWGLLSQENFLNAAIVGETQLSPEKLLRFAQETEQKIGRVRRGVNGPREIDVDILLFDNLVLKTSDLVIPHPRLTVRDFMLQPLLDLAPHAVHPANGVSFQDTLRDMKAERFIIKKCN